MSTPLPQHATLGASSAHRWRRCPGSVREEAKVPTPPSSPAADKGTAAHEIAAEILRGEIPLDILPSIHTWQGEDLDYPVEIDEQMQDRIREYVEACLEIEADGAMNSGDRAEVHIEARFSLEPLNPPGPMYGTCDHAIVWRERRHLDVNDFKSGYIVVEAEKNDQLIMYALGAVVTVWPDDAPPPETITVRIIQPAHNPTVQPWTFTWADLVKFKKELFADAEATLDPDAPLVPGEKQCQWCDAKATCPALRKHAMAVAGEEFAAAPLRGPAAALPGAEELSDDELLDILSKASLVRDWLDGLEGHLHQRVLAGDDTFKGTHKIVQKTTHRKWTDESRTEEWFRQNRVRVKDFTNTKLISPAQAEKLCKRLGTVLPDGLVSKPEGDYIVVERSDPRQAITRGEEFKALPGGSTTQEDA